MESKSYLLSIEYLLVKESSSVLPSMVRYSESTETSIDFLLKSVTF